MRILGIDPGIGITGYGLIETNGDDIELITCGSIQTDKNKTVSERLLEINKDMKELLKKLKPDEAGIEQLFFFKNQKTIIPVAQARGVILTVLEEMGVKIGEYTPLVVKQTMTGHGRATKEEVHSMVRRYVDIDKYTKLDDTVDAVAIAICHSRNIEAGACFGKN